MALVAAVSLCAVGVAPACVAPGSLATVTYSEGATVLAGSGSSTFPWLVTENNDLIQPANSADWLKCSAWWRLGDDRQVNGGETVNVKCLDTVCDVYAFLYHEPPRSSLTNGQLPASLPIDGWSTGSCAPKFTDGKKGTCRMTAFRKQLDKDETTEINVAAGIPAMYLVVVVAPGVRCNDNTISSQKECEAPEASRAKSCTWDATANDGKGECVGSWCPKTGPFPTAPQSACNAVLDLVVSGPEVVVYSTGVTDAKAQIALNAVDTHWQVKKNAGAWVPAIYQKTNKYMSGLIVDHPLSFSAAVPVSRPLAHPDHYEAPPKTASIPNTLFSWRQTFNVPAGQTATFELHYQVGFDDDSLQANGQPHPAGICAHTVWRNNAPIAIASAVAAGAPATSPPRYQTMCMGSIVGGWAAGPNTIEFRIQNTNTYYGFRFVVL